MFIKQGLQRKSERGLHNGTAPLGYARHYGPPGDPSNGELVIVPSEAATVRRIFELYATGRYSDLDIALTINAELDAEGQPLHRTKKGKPFTDASVREILTNPTHTGSVIWHRFLDDEEARQGRHEAIIPQALFDHVHGIRAARAPVSTP